MSYSACPVHSVAFSNPRSATAHMRFKHTEGESTDIVTYESREEIPENYRVEEKTWFEKNPSKKAEDGGNGEEGKAQSRPAKRETVREQQEDPAVETLERMLDTIGVNERDISVAVKGFRNIPSLRDRPENLDAWLRSQIRDRRLHAHIPLVVTTVFELETEDQDIPRYYLGGRGNDSQSFYPRGGDWRSSGALYGSSKNEEPFPFHGLSVIKKLEEQIQEMKADREREKAERVREEAARLSREKEEKWEQRIDRVERAVLALGSEEEAKSKADPLLKEIKFLQTQMEENRLTSLKNDLDKKLGDLSTALSALAKDHTEDVSLEGAAMRLGPTLIEKIRDAGKDLIAEMKGIREGSQAAVAKQPVARTTESMLRLGEVENDILRLSQRKQAQPAAEVPAEPPAQSPEAAAITQALKKEQAPEPGPVPTPGPVPEPATAGGTP